MAVVVVRQEKAADHEQRARSGAAAAGCRRTWSGRPGPNLET